MTRESGGSAVARPSRYVCLWPGLRPADAMVSPVHPLCGVRAASVSHTPSAAVGKSTLKAALIRRRRRRLIEMFVCMQAQAGGALGGTVNSYAGAAASRPLKAKAVKPGNRRRDISMTEVSLFRGVAKGRRMISVGFSKVVCP